MYLMHIMDLSRVHCANVLYWLDKGLIGGNFYEIGFVFQWIIGKKVKERNIRIIELTIEL